MIYGKLYQNDKALFEEVMLTQYFWERMQGLLFRKPLTQQQALLIKPCSSIHCVGMSYNIDVVFLDKRYEIVKMSKTIKPFGFAQCFKAAMTLEMQAGMIDVLELSIGDILQWKST